MGLVLELIKYSCFSLRRLVRDVRCTDSCHSWLPARSTYFMLSTVQKGVFQKNESLVTVTRRRHHKYYAIRTSPCLYNPFKAQWQIYVPPRLTFSNSPSCPHSVFVSLMWIWEQTAIISLYSINWLVCITETECLLRGADWIFIYNSGYVFCVDLRTNSDYFPIQH